MEKIKQNQESIQKIRNNAPRPFGLYTATCMGLDGGYSYYVQNFQDSVFVDFCNGIKKYRKSDFIPQRIKPTVLETRGRVKFVEFAESGVPILLVPSLINKYYIFDLYQDNSFIEFLIDKGFRPFVIDWEEPNGKAEEKIDLKSAVEDYILYFSKKLNKELNQKIHILGYCMGGTLALSSVLKNQDLYESISLVATPVDFSEMPFVGMTQFYRNFYLNFLEKNNVSVEVLQTLFYMQDCKAVINRIKSFAEVDNEEQIKRMVSLEDWLSDCIELENVMARDCIDFWYCKNQIFNENLNIDDLQIPCKVITAEHDAIVPKKASLNKLQHLKNVETINVESGHIGIMIGRKSKEQFYNRLTKSLLKSK